MLIVRAAAETDAELLLAWRNDPETRRWSRNGDPVDPADHRAWLRRVLGDDRRMLLVVEDDAGPVGTARWDDEGGDTWEVSVTVAPGRRGGGLAGPMLGEAERVLLERAGPVTALAVVHQDNAASVRLFTRSGYRPSGPPDDGGFMPHRKTLG